MKTMKNMYYQFKATNMAGIDMSPEVEVTVKSKEELSCPTDPIPNIIPLPKDCEKTQVDVGTCRQNGEKVKFQTKNKYLLIDLEINFVLLSVAANHGREFMREFSSVIGCRRK